MGVSRSPGELANKLSALAAIYATDLPLVQVKEASLAVKTSVLALAPAQLRNVGWKKAKPGAPGKARGAKLGARYNVGNFGGEAQSKVFATGPWQLIERDTKPHIIPALVGSQTKQTGKVRSRSYGPAFGGLRTGVAPIHEGGIWRAHVFHPGTKGKHPWQKGVDAAMPAVKRIFENQAELALRRIF